MIEDIGVRAEGRVCEISSDILPNCDDMRSEFGYTMLCAIVSRRLKTRSRGD